MAYHSKTYSLSDEVIEHLEALKERYGSYNKGLLVLFGIGGAETPRIKLPTQSGVMGTMMVDAEEKSAAGTSLAHARTERKPILKPSERGKK